MAKYVGPRLDPLRHRLGKWKFAFLYGVLLYGFPMALCWLPITWLSDALLEPATWEGLRSELAQVSLLRCLVHLLYWSVIGYGIGLYVWRAEEKEDQRLEQILREMTERAYREVEAITQENTA